MENAACTVKCKTHEDEVCVSFCKSCDCLVCLTCILSPECHQGHTCTTIQEITATRLNEAVPRLRELKNTYSDYENEKTRLDKCRNELESHSQTTLQMISTRTKTLHSQLDQIEKDLTRNVNDFLQNENTTLSKNITALETDWTNLNTLITDIENFKKDDSSEQKSDLNILLSFYSYLKPIDMTYMYQQKQVSFDDGKNDSLKTLFGKVQIKAKEMEEEHEYLYLVPEPVRPPAALPSIIKTKAESENLFTGNEETETKEDSSSRNRLYSSLLAPRPVSLEEDENLAAAQTHVEVEQIYYAAVQLHLPTNNKKLSPKSTPTSSPKPRPKNKTNETFVDYTKEGDEKPGCSTESIQNTWKRAKRKTRPSFVKLKGTISESLRLHAGDDETIWMSYFKSREIKEIKIDGTQRQKINTNFDLYDFTVNTKQEILATENDGCCVSKYSKSTFLHKWTKFCQFESPFKTYGICKCKSLDDTIFVSLQRNPLAGRVVKLSKSGQQLVKFEYGPNREVLFINPGLIVQNPVNEDLCVVDGSTIVVISKNHSVRYSWRGQTPQNVPVTKHEVFSEKAAPTGLDVDMQGNLYISDQGNSRVSVFDKDGQFVKVIRENLDHVTGITIDKAGFLWMAAENTLHLEDINVTPL